MKPTKREREKCGQCRDFQICQAAARKHGLRTPRKNDDAGCCADFIPESEEDQMTKTMTPEEFEKYVKERLRPDESAARIFLDILSKFRTVKWEQSCEGCQFKEKGYVMPQCVHCKRWCDDHYTPATKEKI